MSKPAKDIIVLCFVESAVNMGIDLANFLRIEIGRAKQDSAVDQLSLDLDDNKKKEASEITWFYSPENGSMSYVIPPSVIGWYKEARLSENCLPAGVVFELRLPEALNALYQTIRSRQGQDNHTSDHFLFPPYARKEVGHRIRSFLKDFAEKNGITISPDSLSKTFHGLYVGRYRLNPTFASYIPAKFDSDQRAQRYYTRCDPPFYHDEWYRCYCSLKNDIRLNLLEIAKLDGSVHIDENMLNHLAPSSEPLSVEGIEAFGSKVVPDLVKLKDFFGRLVAMLLSFSFRNPSDRFNYHNLYCLYVYFVFQLSSALRPVADAPVSAHLIDLANNLVFISDKNSPRHQECRIERVPDITISLLKRLAIGGERARVVLSENNSANRRKKRQLFYLIDAKTSRITHMGQNPIRETLKLNELLDYYDYPLNMPRHHLRSDMPRSMNSDLIDAVVGHLRRGKSFWDSYSSGPMEALKIAADYIEQLLEQIGVIDLEYKAYQKK